jgi:peroxiredoxin Q/BCP
VEGCGFRDRRSEFAAKNVQILGISFDSPADNKAFADKNHFEFPLLSDSTKSIAIAYGAAKDATAGYPNRITAVIGPDGTLEQLITDVKAATHPATLLETLPPSK